MGTYSLQNGHFCLLLVHSQPEKKEDTQKVRGFLQGILGFWQHLFVRCALYDPMFLFIPSLLKAVPVLLDLEFSLASNHSPNDTATVIDTLGLL
jgi:hypothetical protein